MSGSDLDGDMYFVSWMKELIFERPNYPPMHFPSSKKVEVAGHVSVDDMVQYMKSSILNDKLGVIANLHSKHADFQKDGIFSKVWHDFESMYYVEYLISENCCLDFFRLALIFVMNMQGQS